MGTAIPVNVSVRLKRDMESVITELYLNNSYMKLEIASDWNLEEEIRNFLKSRDN
jgi:hypothetical protein